MHTIFCFKAREVSNPMLQTGARFKVEIKELQPSEADHSKLKANFVGLRNGVLHAAKFRSHLARLRNSPESSQYLRPTL